MGLKSRVEELERNYHEHIDSPTVKWDKSKGRLGAIAKQGTGNSLGSALVGTSKLVEIVSDLGCGVYSVKVFNDPTDLSEFYYSTLIAYDVAFESMYYVGTRLIASEVQLESGVVT